MGDSHYMHDSTLTDETASSDLSEREALLTINARRTLVLLRSVAEKTCDVLLYEPPSFWVNDTGELQTDYGALKVRVASVFRVDEDEGVEPIFRIVLEEIDELPIEPETPAAKPKRRPMASRLYYFPWRRTTAICIVVVAVVLVGYSAIYGGRLLWQYSLDKAIAEARLAEGNAGAKSDRKEGALASAGTATIAIPATPAAAAATTAAVAVRPSLGAPTLEQVHLSGARSFVVPEVVAALGITAKQAATLKNVNDATEKAIHDLDHLWQSDSPEQHSRRLAMILDAARQQSLKLLTAEQRHRLVALMK